MTEEEKLYFFKKNVGYTIGIRFYIGDSKGKVLTHLDPYVAVKASGRRDFLRANRIAIVDGLLMETEEPVLDSESPNSIDDEKAIVLVKNVFALKKALAEITSATPAIKLLDEAKLQNRPTKTIKLIEARLKDFMPDDYESPEDMKSVY